MFCTFATEHGALIVRTQDIRRIEDGAQGCVLGWVEENQIHYSPIQGTAAENLARLIAEDQARSAAYAELQQRQSQGFPVPPVLRGKARK